jgi:RNA polymerase sigma factor (sigma-70 family)
MAHTPLANVLQYIRGLTVPPTTCEASDGQLLERFATRHEEAAFATLLRRHGPMVLGVCRRTSRHEQDAEDAFQATFLLLARNPGSIRQRESVSSWLHGVAYRLAVRARTQAAHRNRCERRQADMYQSGPNSEAAWRELQTVLDEELKNLPEKYRAVLVLCCLEDHTIEQARRHLGCPLGTVRSRLARARQLLRHRLARRGMTLSIGALAIALAASAAEAALPAHLLQSTFTAALRRAANGAAEVSGPIAHLIEGGPLTMIGNKLKITMALLLAVSLAALGAGVLTHQAQADRSGERRATASERRRPPSSASRPQGKENTPKPETNPQAPAETMVVTGQVVDAQGKAVPGARISVVAAVESPLRNTHWPEAVPQVLGEGKADAQGKFRLTVPRTSRARHAETFLLAASPGHGLARAGFDVDARQPDLKLALAPEQVVHGRLINLQGLPAQKVRVRVLKIVGEKKQQNALMIELPTPPRGLTTWPGPATSDDKGRFTLKGLPAHSTLTLQVEGDDRFAHQRLECKTADKEKTWSLGPGYVLHGTVTCADTGKAVPNIQVVVTAFRDPNPPPPEATIERRADARGQFRISPPLGKFYLVTAYPPAGMPYLPIQKEVSHSKPEVGKQAMRFVLPRGVLVRGRVIETGSNKPVAGAVVRFVANEDNNRFYRREFLIRLGRHPESVTGTKGEFEIAVLPGPGHLLINGPSPVYAGKEITNKLLYSKGIIPNRRLYPDGLVPLNLKPQANAHALTVKLRRGVTWKGKVVDPMGKSVREAVLVSRYYHPHGLDNYIVWPKEVKAGRFELAGGDPDRTTEVFFLDAKNRLGATVKLSGKDAAKPITVKLQPCGQAKARIVDGKGKPIANRWLRVELLVTPGVPFEDAFKDPGPTADTCPMAYLDGQRHGKLFTDAQGRVTIPTLIPGATFWLSDFGFQLKPKPIKAEAGKTVELGDIVIKKE